MQLKKVQEVYAIVNLINGNIYVGSSPLGSMQTRFYKHLFSGKGNKLYGKEF